MDILKRLAKFGLLITAFLLVVYVALYLFFGREKASSEPIWGVSFDRSYASFLGQNWKKTYLSILDDLGVRHLRLVALWSEVEPKEGEYDFSHLDFQVNEAQKRGAKVIIGVGRRLPRWPECHVPNWAKTLSDEEQKERVLRLIPKIVSRYMHNSALEFWQVENEPFVWFFGECPRADEEFLKGEINLVRSIDPEHPVVLTESGELSSWFKVSRNSDYVGVSVYRLVFDPVILKSHHRHFLPASYYRIRANIFRKLGWVEDVFVTELQAEPWFDKPITEAPYKEQIGLFGSTFLASNIDFARSMGFPRAYLWGAEWWYYMREVHSDSSFLDEVRRLWKED